MATARQNNQKYHQPIETCDFKTAARYNIIIVITESTKEIKKKIEPLLNPVSAEITNGRRIQEPTKQTKPIFFTKTTAFSFMNKNAPKICIIHFPPAIEVESIISSGPE